MKRISLIVVALGEYTFNSKTIVSGQVDPKYKHSVAQSLILKICDGPTATSGKLTHWPLRYRCVDKALSVASSLDNRRRNIHVLERIKCFVGILQTELPLKC